MTLRILTHELRTPINHIIGYSEMLLEDLDGVDSSDLHTMRMVHAAGKELLTTVNAELRAAPSPDGAVTPEILSTLQSAVERGIRRIRENLEADGLKESQESAGDVVKILNATTRLAEFARAGTIRTSE